MKAIEGILLDRDGTPILNPGEEKGGHPSSGRASPSIGRKLAMGSAIVAAPVAIFAGLALIALIAAIVLAFFLLGSIFRMLAGRPVMRSRTVVVRRGF